MHIGSSHNDSDVSFKITRTSSSRDAKVLSADLELFKKSLNESEIEDLSTEECNISKDGIDLKLILNNEMIDTVTLTPSDLQEDKWIDFPPIEKWYNKWLKEEQNSSLTNDGYVHLQLVLSPQCSSFLSLRDIGVTTAEGYEPLLVIYAQSPRDNLADQLFHQKLSNYIKSKRDARPTEITSGPYPVNKTIPCHLVNYSVSTKILSLP